MRRGLGVVALLAVLLLPAGCAATALSAGSELDRARTEVADQLAALSLVADVAAAHGAVGATLDVAVTESTSRLDAIAASLAGMPPDPARDDLSAVVAAALPAAERLRAALPAGPERLTAVRRELATLAERAETAA
jgi:hypothetical protein